MEIQSKLAPKLLSYFSHEKDSMISESGFAFEEHLERIFSEWLLIFEEKGEFINESEMVRLFRRFILKASKDRNPTKHSFFDLILKELFLVASLDEGIGSERIRKIFSINYERL